MPRPSRNRRSASPVNAGADFPRRPVIEGKAPVKLYIPHSFQVVGEKVETYIAGEIRDVEAGLVDLFKNRFGAVPAADAPVADPIIQPSVTETQAPAPAAPPAPAPAAPQASAPAAP